MQITFKSLVRPRRAAKALCEHVRSLKLSEAQEAIALMCGYANWRDLKTACEGPGAEACEDDEDLDAVSLSHRREFQARQAQAALGNTMAQAREVVRLVTPTARVPASDVRDAGSRGKPLVGTTVYMPFPNTRFEPRYAAVFGILHDVERVRIDFRQPTEQDPVPTHLASSMTFHFTNGRRLELQGSYFWKFLDLVPSELSDADGNYLGQNKYSRETMEALMYRLRKAYEFMFTAGSVEASLKKPPLWVEIDLVSGKVSTRKQAELEGHALHEFRRVFGERCESVLGDLQGQFDAFVEKALKGPRVELKVVSKGGRGSGMVGNEYVSGKWDGTGHWTVEDLMHEMTPVPLSPSGCGGNLHYRDLLNRELEDRFKEVLASACEMAVQDKGLYEEMSSQLEVESGDAPRKEAAETRAGRLADAILLTSERLELAFRLTSALVKRQRGRTLCSWSKGLTSDRSMQGPTERLEAILKEFRQSKAKSG